MWFIVLFRSVCFVFYILCLNDQFIFESRVLNYPLTSVQFSRSVVSNSLQPRVSQHVRPPCPSPTPRVTSPRLTSIESVMPSSHLILCRPLLRLPPQSLQASASESFPMSQLFVWGGQSTGVSTLASFLPMKCQGWCPSEWTGWISLQSKGLSRVFSNTTV